MALSNTGEAEFATAPRVLQALGLRMTTVAAE